MTIVYIRRDVLGEPLDVSIDLERGTSGCTSKIPDESWVLGDVGSNYKSINDLAALSGMTINDVPDKKFCDAFQLLDQNAIVRWRHALPKKAFMVFFDGLIEQIRATLSVDQSYYLNVFRQTQACLESLEPAKIDTVAMNKLLLTETNHSNLSTIQSFRPNVEGFAAVPVYNRFVTATGRLTISRGPRILTLAKHFKGIIKSRYTDGKVFSIDYSSIEPRIALLSSGKDAPDDIYSYISDSVMQGTISRKQAKDVSISLLYGAAKKTIGRVSGLRNGDLDAAVAAISNYFCVETLQANLLEQVRIDNTIKNAFGRRIIVNDRRKLINYFSQSSGVDAALLGFYNAINIMKEQALKIHPIYIIHDSLVIDVHPDHINYIEDLAKACERIPGFTERFHVKHEEFDFVRS